MGLDALHQLPEGEKRHHHAGDADNRETPTHHGAHLLVEGRLVLMRFGYHDNAGENVVEEGAQDKGTSN